MSRVAHVLTVSTRAAAGEYADRSGPILVDWLRTAGFEVTTSVVADVDVEAALEDLIGREPGSGGPRAGRGRGEGSTGAGQPPDLVITTGGTGPGADDVTPEATGAHITRELPGVAEALRRAGVEAGVPTAVLSRGVAGVVHHATGATVVVNVAGSPGACRDAVSVLDPIVGHLLGVLAGDDVHGGSGS